MRGIGQVQLNIRCLEYFEGIGCSKYANTIHFPLRGTVQYTNSFVNTENIYIILVDITYIFNISILIATTFHGTIYIIILKLPSRHNYTDHICCRTIYSTLPCWLGLNTSTISVPSRTHVLTLFLCLPKTLVLLRFFFPFEVSITDPGSRWIIPLRGFSVNAARKNTQILYIQISHWFFLYIIMTVLSSSKMYYLALYLKYNH